MKERNEDVPASTSFEGNRNLSEEEFFNDAFDLIVKRYFPDGINPDMLTDKIKGQILLDMLDIAMNLPQNKKFLESLENRLSEFQNKN